MGRLTEKDYCGYDIANRSNFNGYVDNDDFERIFKSLQKLGKLEDIEEELGIDLITLFKIVLTKTIWNNNTKQYEWVDLHYSCHHFVLSTNRCLYTHDCDCLLEFKDYGKTWALTREELEK